MNPELPADVEVGEIAISAGVGFCGVVIVNVCAFDVPPPGVGFTTVTETVPVAFTSAARIAAVTCVEETNVVVLAEPFQFTTDPETKFVPSTVSVKSELPAEVEVGLIEVVVGTGLLIVNVRAAEVPPPGAGVTTSTEAVPAVAMSIAGTMAVSSPVEI